MTTLVKCNRETCVHNEKRECQAPVIDVQDACFLGEEMGLCMDYRKRGEGPDYEED
jgi:hypothetical protein